MCGRGCARAPLGREWTLVDDVTRCHTQRSNWRARSRCLLLPDGFTNQGHPKAAALTGCTLSYGVESENWLRRCVHARSAIALDRSRAREEDAEHSRARKLTRRQTRQNASTSCAGLGFAFCSKNTGRQAKRDPDSQCKTRCTTYSTQHIAKEPAHDAAPSFCCNHHRRRSSSACRRRRSRRPPRLRLPPQRPHRRCRAAAAGLLLLVGGIVHDAGLCGPGADGGAHGGESPEQGA